MNNANMPIGHIPVFALSLECGTIFKYETPAKIYNIL